jgi:tRNA pseudouridine55 synthase
MSGEIQQVPPGVSAIKVDGKRAYRLAREGAAPELAARPVTISALDILATRRSGELLDADIAVTCSSGTYIRAIARDLGRELGTCGHLTELRRTRVGPYLAADAATLDELEAGLRVIPLAQAAAEAFARRDLTADEARQLSHGARLPATGAPGSAQGPIAAFAPDGTLVALLTEESGEAKPLAVFAAQ